jgi:hypothetical protein
MVFPNLKLLRFTYYLETRKSRFFKVTQNRYATSKSKIFPQQAWMSISWIVFCRKII